MGTELRWNLTDKEKKELKYFKEIISQLERKIDGNTQTLEEIGVKRQRLQSYLDDNLLKRKKELEEDDDIVDSLGHKHTGGVGLSALRTGQNQRSKDLESCKQDLEQVTETVKNLEVNISKAKSNVNEQKKEFTKFENELENIRAEDNVLRKELERAEENEEMLMTKRSMCISKRELYMNKIQELGSLPTTSELKAHVKLSNSTLLKKIQSINRKLKKYSHVNKKAYDQFVNFSEQRESLLERKHDLDDGADKVQELIDSLDRQKDEAINRTFRGVSAHFKDVFKELVPNGAGELIMKTLLDEGNVTGNGNMAGDDNNIEASSLYRGIGIKVRFSSKGKNFLMSQLSGGQKALVALALIFAIQRCDPAPFYLFDELDQALDSTYRAAVATLIKNQSQSEKNPTQFICTTFRPEIVAASNQWYGISHHNKVSNVHLMTKKDSLNFIANLMSKDEAVDEAKSLISNVNISHGTTSSSTNRKTPEEKQEEKEE